MAIKLHFTQKKFDVFINPNINCNIETFEKRNDKLLFDKLSRKFPKDNDLIQYYVASFANGFDAVVYSEQEGADYYQEWIKRKESITKAFSDDLNLVVLYSQKNKLKKNNVLEFDFGIPPALLNLYLGKYISIQSVRILDDYLRFIEEWKTAQFVSSFWDADILRVEKLTKFVKYDKIKIGKIVDQFNEELNEL